MSAKIITDTTVTIYHNGQVAVGDSTDPNWGKILEALKGNDYELAIALLDKPKVIEQFLRGSRLRIEGQTVFYGKHQLTDALARRILQQYGDGFNISPMEKFVENLYQNPSYRAIAELYRFLEANSLPITDDGHFMAYKRVRADFTDVHSGTFDNSVGKVCMMPRQEVNDDCNQTCSAGLHFCSLGYLSHFVGDKLIAIKINPRDVVSIPVDYDNTKGRCCRYEVMEELPLSIISDNQDFWEKSVVEYDDDEDENEDEFDPMAYM